MRNGANLCLAGAVLTALLIWVGSAGADNASIAQALFDEGRRLVKQGDYPAACAKFAESYRLDPAGGTLINLASCHEKQGKTATAWAEFRDALSQATRDQKEQRIQEAKKRIAELEPHLARLRVVVSDPSIADLLVKFDEQDLGRAAWGVPVPVDPGNHTLSASAPGRSTWTKSLTITAESSSDVTIPVLSPAESAPVVTSQPSSSAAPSPPDAIRPSGAPVSAYVLGGIGIVGIGVGTYFGVVALKRKSDSDPECTSAGCSQHGADLLRDADRAAWGSNISFGVGVVTLAVSTYLFATSPTSASKTTAIRVSPSIGPSWGLGASGTW